MATRPLLIVSAISKNGGIIFILPDQEIALDEGIAPSAWKILELCNGLNTSDFIAQQCKDLGEEFVIGFLNDLNSLGILIDSREYYKHFHALSCNPMVYKSDLTGEEIAEHVVSSRMSVKTGKSFTFKPNNNSLLVKLQELRSSCRNFTGEPLSLGEIGGVLNVGYSLRRHAVPSAGGLYPMKLFVISLQDQQNFPAGYYEYDNERDSLVLFKKELDPQRIFFAFNDIELPFNASVVVVIAADANRQPRKYSNRGYRFMAIEAGQIAQNISLGVVENGLASCELGDILEDVISDELELTDCLPMLAIAIGKKASTERSTNKRFVEQLEKEFVGTDKPVRSVWLYDDTLANNFGKSYVQFLAQARDGQIASGISTSWEYAKLKAIAEGYERQCSVGGRWDVRSMARALSGAWLDPTIVAPLTDEQYRLLPHLQKFDESIELEWIRGRDHTGKTVWVPIDLVFYLIEGINRKLIVDSCSSGFAAHMRFREARERGILELVERDSLMRHWYMRTSPRQVALSALPIYLQNRARYWRDRGREMFVLDLSQRGVIVTEVVITSEEYPCFVSGASSTLGRFEESAIKAFQEAESRLIDGLNNPSEKPIESSDVRHVIDHELLYAQSRKYHEHVQFLFDGPLSNEVPVASTSLDVVERELEVVTVDVSEEGSSLHVVKVLSPSLIPISFGFGADHYTHHSLCGTKVIPPNVPHYFA